MRRFLPAYLFTVTLLLAQAPSFEGDWFGTLQAGPMKLRLALHLKQGANGTLTGSMDSLDQNAMGLPASTVTVTGREIEAIFSTLGASYKGTLSDDRKRLAGTFHQAGASLPLAFEKVDKIPEVRRPQEPKPPYPYHEEQVSYTNAGVKLAGTLTVPRSEGPYPAVLLLTGSGPQDRNEAIAGHKPFLVLADYLTRRGIAVLRVDDRGVGGSTGSITDSTEDDFASDALAGVGFLKARKEIDPARIGLLGHSEGGLVATLAATRSADVAFVVLMAAPGVTGEQVLLKQVENLNRAAGASETAAEANLALERKLFTILKSEKDNATALADMRKAMAHALEALPGNVQKAKEIEMKLMTTKWYRSFLVSDPQPLLRKLEIPVLAMNGSLDVQVAPEQNLTAIRAALEAGGNKDFTVALLPGLNHLLQHAETGMMDEYSEIEETINPVALRKMGDWIASHTQR